MDQIVQGTQNSPLLIKVLACTEGDVIVHEGWVPPRGGRATRSSRAGVGRQRAYTPAAAAAAAAAAALAHIAAACVAPGPSYLARQNHSGDTRGDLLCASEASLGV